MPCLGVLSSLFVQEVQKRPETCRPKSFEQLRNLERVKGPRTAKSSRIRLRSVPVRMYIYLSIHHTLIHSFIHSLNHSFIHSCTHSLTHSLTRKPVGPWQSRIANGLAAGLHHSCVETLFRVSKITEHVHDHDHAHLHHQYRHDHIIHHPQGELSVATCSIFKSGHRRDVMCRSSRLGPADSEGPRDTRGFKGEGKPWECVRAGGELINCRRHLRAQRHSSIHSPIRSLILQCTIYALRFDVSIYLSKYLTISLACLLACLLAWRSGGTAGGRKVSGHLGPGEAEGQRVCLHPGGFGEGASQTTNGTWLLGRRRRRP